MFNFVRMADFFLVVYSLPSRCISRLRIGGTYTNNLYYYRHLSMSINVNKRMCHAFAKVMYFTVIACKLHSLRLLASLKKKKHSFLDRGRTSRNRVLLHHRMLEFRHVVRISSFTHCVFTRIILCYLSFLPMHARRKRTLPISCLEHPQSKTCVSVI